jgi:hypothetical protein
MTAETDKSLACFKETSRRMKRCPGCGERANLSLAETVSSDRRGFNGYQGSCGECGVMGAVKHRRDLAVRAWNQLSDRIYSGRTKGGK